MPRILKKYRHVKPPTPIRPVMKYKTRVGIVMPVLLYIEETLTGEAQMTIS